MSSYDRHVLNDRLRLAAQEPAATHVWHRLYRMAIQAPADDLQAALQHVRTHVPASGLGGFLAATFAHALTHDVADLASASRIFVGSQLPSEAGLALLHTVYAAALGCGGNAAGFAGLVHDSGFLDVAACLGQRLVRRPGVQERRPASVNRKLRKVAVVAPTLSSAFHAPTEMALRHAVALVERGVETAVFAAQEFQMLDMTQWLGVPRRMKIDPAQPAGWPRPNGELRVRVASSELSMNARWWTLWREIRQFDPDLVLFIGPYSPMVSALHPRYPVVGLGTNALAPVGPLDLWLAPQAGLQPTWAPNFNSATCAVHSHRFSIKPASLARDRHALGLPGQAQVWVTTGTRLALEIGPGWRDQVLAALERHPHCHWLVVGMDRPWIESRPIEHPRVHLRGFDADLASLLKTCDLYLNPPRMGGGHSVLCAMAQGLPVLALAGGDGGDKLGPWRHFDEAHYFGALDQLAGAPAALRTLGNRLRQHYLDTFDLEGGAPALLDLLQEVALRPLVRTGV